MGKLSITLGALADLLGAQLQTHQAENANLIVSGVATLMQATPHEISFFTNRHYRHALQNTHAAAVILVPDDSFLSPVPTLMIEQPYVAYARAAQFFNPVELKPAERHPTAWISPQAELGNNVHVGPQASINAAVQIGANSVISAGCVIGKQVKIGKNCYLHPNVTLYDDCLLGDRVIIHAGAVIGADGFGLAHDGQHWLKVPQLGRVCIGNDVEIGANTSIDRGALGDTLIGDEVKLDNQIQIAHNVTIGSQTAIAGCVGIAGSTHIGKRCLIGGGVGIVGHIDIVDDVHITGGSNVLQSIKKPGLYSAGVPLQENQDWHKNYLRFKQLDKLSRRLTELERQMAELYSCEPSEYRHSRNNK